MNLPIVVLVVLVGVTFGEGFPQSNDNQQLKIVGGYPVGIEQFPYQVSLQIVLGSHARHTCGGCILTANRVLTAGHCVERGYRLVVRAGSNSLKSGGQLIDVQDFRLHPKFDEQHLNFDVAVLRLKKNLVFGDAVAPIPLVNSEYFYAPYNNALVTGWGSLSSDSALSDRLEAVSVPLVSNEQCAKAYSSLNNITENMFCAGLLETGGRDSCQGDSGGPIAMNGVLIGVVSWGYRCAEPGYPGVYTKLYVFRDWINSQL